MHLNAFKSQKGDLNVEEENIYQDRHLKRAENLKEHRTLG